MRYSFLFSSRIIILHLPTEYHHPQKQHRQYDTPRKARLPTAADVTLRQPRQRLNADAVELLVLHEVVAVAVDVAVAVELDRGFDECGHPQDEEDETAQEDYARDKHAP